MLLQKINAVVKKRGIKQKDICAALSLSQSYTSELLSGKKDFSLDLLEKLCAFLNVEITLVDKYRK
ncbi:MAG: helix-turn-helix domain-containing protein [Bacteroides sp.]|nr:helix-turn-helix domain-containing protein [Prevotella sp.]MCM1407819.1 helix-turn-helix domain-containing protein [Treponema brennaborense]MCM1470872.1 helix-turn-helix domain-containing protein [Bacteroides sp.]